jgi:hypothetical protein
MDSRQVARRQAQEIKGRVAEVRDYLCRLRVRMAKRGSFPPSRLRIGNRATWVIVGGVVWIASRFVGP